MKAVSHGHLEVVEKFKIDPAKDDLNELLLVTARTADKLMARHVIPYVRAGKLLRFKITQVDRALEQKYRLNSAWE